MRQKDLQEGPVGAVKKYAAKTHSDFVKGFNATRPGGALGPDAFGNKLKSWFTQANEPAEPAKTPAEPKKKDKVKKGVIVDLKSIPNMTSFKDKNDMLFTFDEKTGKWTSRDGKIELSRQDGAVAYNKAKEKSKLESEDTTMKRSVKEGLAELAQQAEHDHEVQMARADLYKIAKYAIKLHEMLKNIPEERGLEGWQQAKITKASDYLSSVFHNLDYEMKFGEQAEASQIPTLPKTESSDPYKQQLAAKLDEKAKSKAQQRFMGMVYAAKKGEKPASADVAKVAKGMSKSDAKDFAKTKHKGKPEHVKKKD